MFGRRIKENTIWDRRTWMKRGKLYRDGENYRSKSWGMGKEGQWAQNVKASLAT